MWTDSLPLTRRGFLNRSAFGIGTLALAHLLREDGLLANPAKKPGENLPQDLRARPPHFAPKATALISLFMHGGPSHVDLFDPKPELSRLNGKDYGGDVVVNPRGGLIGCGHPLGATGVAQAAEVFVQLRNEAGARQVTDAAIGLTHNNSGMGEHVVMIYGKDAA